VSLDDVQSDFVVAVDGPAASGKGSIATRLGEAFDLPVLDTGLLYRCVGVLMDKAHEDMDDEGAACAAAAMLTADQLDDPALRTRAAGELASRVAVHARVRDALMEFQRTFATQAGGAILDGRDIGRARGPRPPPLEAAGGPGRGRVLRGRAGRHPAARRPRRGPRHRPDAPGARRRLAGHLRNDYRAGRRCGPPHRRGGARQVALFQVGKIRLSNPNAPSPRTAAGRFT
jgi:hypothetical protein